MNETNGKKGRRLNEGILLAPQGAQRRREKTKQQLFSFCYTPACTNNLLTIYIHIYTYIYIVLFIVIISVMPVAWTVGENNPAKEKQKQGIRVEKKRE